MADATGCLLSSPIPDSPRVTGRRLGALLLGYLLAVVGVIVLAPFQFAVPTRFTAHWWVPGPGWGSEILLNVVLFIPLGFLGRRIPGAADGSPARWFLLGFLVSLAIEAIQLFLPGRYPTATDLGANAVGAWLGALGSDVAVRGLGGGDRAVRRLLLDVPLAGVAWLLIPLLWLDGLAAPGDAARLWLQLPLAAAGGVVVAGAARTAEAADRGVAGVVALVAAAWWLLAAIPTLRVDPIAVVLGLTVAVLAAELADPLWRWRRRRERRLEPVVVAVALALLAWHLLAAGPVFGPTDAAGGGEVARRAVLRWVQAAAALTLVGYLVAEGRGRGEAPLARAVVLPLLVGAVGGGILGGAGGAALGAAAAALGGALYVLQRDHVIALRHG